MQSTFVTAIHGTSLLSGLTAFHTSSHCNFYKGSLQVLVQLLNQPSQGIPQSAVSNRKTPSLRPGKIQLKTSSQPAYLNFPQVHECRSRCSCRFTDEPCCLALTLRTDNCPISLLREWQQLTDIAYRNMRVVSPHHSVSITIWVRRRARLKKGLG